jgi:transcriptional regulator with PAS, ATPase and Fis domain
MQEVYERISRVIEMDVKTVLILGETGTGKDLVAKTIHYQGNRKNHPFTEINCANIPDNLLESELFGHEKGAFTDAKALKRGLFEQAPMGTILLNEIGHMKMDLQAKLLRVIENRKFRRVGGVKELDIDVRLLAATNRDLSEAVGKDEFREDLYYRLRLVPVYMPPLRERKEDIPLLCRHFIQIANREFRKNVQGITNEVEEIFIRYDWPGNVRELKNVIEGAIILGDEDQIQIRHLPREVIKAITDASFEFEFPESGVSMARVEKDLIEQALKKSGGNQMRAARLLDITRHALRHRMKKYGFL